MRKLGLNTVQVPVPVDVFDPSSKPDQAVLDFLTNDLIAEIQDADLQVILELKGEDNDDAALLPRTMLPRNKSLL